MDGATDMEFVQKFTPLDFQVKNFTPSILPNFNNFSKKKTQKMSENGEICTDGKSFTLPPALMGWTNSTSENYVENKNCLVLKRKLRDIFGFWLILTFSFQPCEHQLIRHLLATTK